MRIAETNSPEINGQEKTALDWLAGRAVCESHLGQF